MGDFIKCGDIRFEKMHIDKIDRKLRHPISEFKNLIQNYVEMEFGSPVTCDGDPFIVEGKGSFESETFNFH